MVVRAAARPLAHVDGLARTPRKASLPADCEVRSSLGSRNPTTALSNEAIMIIAMNRSNWLISRKHRRSGCDDDSRSTR